MGVTMSQTEETTAIRLDGAIDIAVAAELKASLLEALKLGRQICISTEAATDLDVAAFQLLWAAGREARRAGLKFTVMEKWSEPVRSSLECMGLAGLLVV